MQILVQNNLFFPATHKGSELSSAASFVHFEHSKSSPANQLFVKPLLLLQHLLFDLLRNLRQRTRRVARVKTGSIMHFRNTPTNASFYWPLGRTCTWPTPKPFSAAFEAKKLAKCSPMSSATTWPRLSDLADLQKYIV